MLNPVLVWSSSNEAVATVDQNGLITPVANGIASIRVKNAESTCMASCIVIVNLPADEENIENPGTT
ncbi:MAG: Ig-like domain-containing protein, partial [Lachnospiraceae bacterium]|nr:Ig-like domain-containing protein [Lachnospiraceae bacterium]